jgi:hypothetical protein
VVLSISLEPDLHCMQYASKLHVLFLSDIKFPGI